jgi:hypothetical protein
LKTCSASSKPLRSLPGPSSSRATSEMTTSYRLAPRRARAAALDLGVSTLAPNRLSSSHDRSVVLRMIICPKDPRTAEQF